MSHLACLSKHFLRAQAHDAESNSMIPRGGDCQGCQKYVLWGDLVRGCYRREQGSAGDIPSEGEDDLKSDQSESSAMDLVYAETPGKAKRRTKLAGKSKSSAKKLLLPSNIAVRSESGESFDLDAISSATDDSQGLQVTPKTRGRPRKLQTALSASLSLLSTKSPSRKRKDVQAEQTQLSMDTVIAGLPPPHLSPPHTTKKLSKIAQAKPTELTMDTVISRLPLPSHLSAAAKKRSKATFVKSGRKGMHTLVMAAEESGEFFDLNSISMGSSDEDGVPFAPTRRPTPSTNSLPGPSFRQVLPKRKMAEDKDLAEAMSTLSLRQSAIWMDISD